MSSPPEQSAAAMSNADADKIAGPRFSVVIATINRRAMLLECVRSCIEQTYPAHEIIVVSDGGTDDSADAIRKQYPSVIFEQLANSGPAFASNTGFSLATGDWICLLDDDDLFHRDKLAVTAKYIAEHPDCRAIRNPVWFFADSEDGPRDAFGFRRDFVATNLNECHAAVANGDPSDNNWDYLQIEGNSLKLLLEKNRGVKSSSVIERKTLIRAGCFCPMQSYTEDWTMFVNVARQVEWHTIPRRLGFTRFHKSQSTGSANASNAMNILGAHVNAWYSGRPLKHRTRVDEAMRELARYGPIYRERIQSCLWICVRTGQFRMALLVRRFARLLLPRFRDWLYIHIPPQITWRWERYILGMHK